VAGILETHIKNLPSKDSKEEEGAKGGATGVVDHNLVHGTLLQVFQLLRMLRLQVGGREAAAGATGQEAEVGVGGQEGGINASLRATYEATIAAVLPALEGKLWLGSSSMHCGPVRLVVVQVRESHYTIYIVIFGFYDVYLR
jgi:hypothetical protein